MRKLLAATAAFGLALTGLAAVGDVALAVDDALTVDCGDGGVTAGQTFSDSVVGEDIVITNSSSTDACTLVLATSVATAADTADAGVADDVTGTAPNLTIVASGVVTLTIVDSGTFTIESAGAGDEAQTFVIDSCSLPGAGVEASPWEIDSQADFQLIGDSTGTNSCILGGYYRQTADLIGAEALDSYTNDRVTGAFTGTYDGDHYTITLSGGDGTGGWADGFSSRQALFANLDGTIRKVRLTGSLYSSNASVSSLVHNLSGVVTESSSNVSIRVSGTSAYAAGLVWWADGNGARIQYSKYDGQIWWTHTDASTASNAHFGGLVAANNNFISLEIRDSYARPTFKWDNDVTANLADDAFGTGGLLARPNDADEVTFVRSYAAVTFDDTGTGAGAEPAHGGVVHDGLAGNGTGILASTFYLNQAAIDGVVGTGTSTGVDVYTDGGFPEIVPLTTVQLSDITSFRSEESSTTSGSPSGLSELSTASSTGSLSEADYRWAIEPGNVSVFVPSSYTDEADVLTRQLIADTSVAQTYQSRGTNREGSATGYPSLGRVWEICAEENDGYPVLVWEERTCGSGGGSSSSSPDDDDEETSAAAALGLTDAEYLEFLASGLTLEQFKAQRLAATGPSIDVLSLGGFAVFALLGLGFALMWVNRREKVAGRL